MNKKGLLLIPVLLVLISGLASLTGCGIGGGGDYKTATVMEGFVHFSFEYPASYNEPSFEEAGGNNWKETSVTACRVVPGKTHCAIMLGIDARRADENTPNVK